MIRLQTAVAQGRGSLASMIAYPFLDTCDPSYNVYKNPTSSDRFWESFWAPVLDYCAIQALMGLVSSASGREVSVTSQRFNTYDAHWQLPGVVLYGPIVRPKVSEKRLNGFPEMRRA